MDTPWFERPFGQVETIDAAILAKWAPAFDTVFVRAFGVEPQYLCEHLHDIARQGGAIAALQCAKHGHMLRCEDCMAHHAADICPPRRCDVEACDEQVAAVSSCIVGVAARKLRRADGTASLIVNGHVRTCAFLCPEHGAGRHFVRDGVIVETHGGGVLSWPSTTN